MRGDKKEALSYGQEHPGERGKDQELIKSPIIARRIQNCREEMEK